MNEIAKNHHANIAWQAVMDQIRSEMARRGVHAAQTVVLVPYAQLIKEARDAWKLGADVAHFVPRFETTQNWTSSFSGLAAVPDDLRLDSAFDLLTAASLLLRAGLSVQDLQGNVMAQRVMEAAWSLAKVAAAIHPDKRMAWGQRLSNELTNGMDAPVVALEVAVGQIALAWAANSSYATDSLFGAHPGLLVVLEGFLSEPLANALRSAAGDRGVSIALLDATGLAAKSSHVGQEMSGAVAVHALQDTEDEAQAAAACVLNHLRNGRSPVALVANDRLLTRRVRALLGESGIRIRDETGWKLSTTRAAAALMSLLRACRWDASCDAVLDWLKNAPAYAPGMVAQAEVAWRKAGMREWRAASAGLPQSATGSLELVEQANLVRATLVQSRSLADWLDGLRLALHATGQWTGLASDPAGKAVLKTLRLTEIGEAAESFANFPLRMSASDFTAWVSQTLEGESFKPAHPDMEQVVILPLSQLLGRAVPAVVMPGCDEASLPVVAEPPGQWSVPQRELLGLPSREALADATRRAWHYALQSPKIDLLWRTSEAGERVMASPLLQLLQLQGCLDRAADPRALRELSMHPSTMPAPGAAALPVLRLSSSGYEDLRRCPYRFFALRQLRLQESDELDVDPGKRDFGNWLHGLLKLFHEALKESPSQDASVRETMINQAADQALRALGLTGAEFLPFAASWPRMRSGYLQWLGTHEAQGTTYTDGEIWKEARFGALTLVGKIDRLDQLQDGTAVVMDYKTEARTATTLRVKPDSQDTQLAFYAALMSHDTLDAAYVNLGEKEPTKTYGQPDIVALRDQLIDGIRDDVTRINQGARLAAMGEGKACDFCAARGLCRKDMWTLL